MVGSDIWIALGDSAVRGDGKMERDRLEVHGPFAKVRTVNNLGRLVVVEFHNTADSLVGCFGLYLSLELPLRPPLAYKGRAYVVTPSR